MFVRRAGNPNGPILVLLHGGGLAGWMWEAQVGPFADHRLLIPDLPGHGESVDRPFTTIEEAATLVAAAIDAERDATRRSVAVAGFSLGAQVAVELLSSRPGIADRAVIVSALVKPMPLPVSAMLPMLELSLPLAQYRWFARLQARQAFIPDERFEQYLATTRSLKADTFVAMMRANLTFRTPPGWARNPARTLVLAGERELRVVRESARELAGALPSARLEILPGIGHGLPLQDPELFTGLLMDWLAVQKTG